LISSPFPTRDVGSSRGTVADYRYPSPFKSVWQLVNTLLPLCGLWHLMYLSLAWSYGLTLLLAIPSAGLLVRLFIIQHDCGHHSFFRSRFANNALGTFCSIFTLTPYALWRRNHSRHHASSGNLNHRGHGDVWTLTVDEYKRRSWFGRLHYRLYRNPIFLFGIGPAVLFILRQRFTVGIPATWRRERKSVHATNAAIAVLLVGAYCTTGLIPFLLVHSPIVLLASSIGAWMFFIQHQYEKAYWQPDNQWDFKRSALDGSSYYRLPPVLQWFTGNIGFHHIHHLNSRIPNYNLAECFANVAELRKSVTIGVRESLRLPQLKLWDERLQRMVRFNEAHCGRA
jgi:omega-6 fatty acid desaturase (delta-12 desaturase)